MKKWVIWGLSVALFFCSGWANAQDRLVIIFEDGSNQTVNLDKPTYSIKSINFEGGIAASSNNTIVVVAGTYGKNCGAPYANKTDHLAKACNSRARCEYTVDVNKLGDPVYGCGKDYVAEWRCGNDPAVRSTSATPEAGYGKKITLSCPR